MRTRAPSRERTVNCVHCGTEFKTRHSRGKYCSTTCSREGERKSWREYRARNIDTRRASDLRIYRENKPAVIARIEKYRKTPAGIRARRKADAKQRALFPEKYAARQAVLIALRSGRLKRQPCKCGALKVQAHHHDYSNPLDVEWLCDDCHRSEHRRAA